MYDRVTDCVTMAGVEEAKEAIRLFDGSYPEARDQYRRLLNVVSEIQEAKATNERAMNISEEATVGAEYFDDDLVDLEALLGDDAFMSTEA